MAQTRRCPHCQSMDTVLTLQEPTRQLYLCKGCRTVWGIFDVSLRRATISVSAADSEASDE
jgi:transposase-like protein